MNPAKTRGHSSAVRRRGWRRRRRKGTAGCTLFVRIHGAAPGFSNARFRVAVSINSWELATRVREERRGYASPKPAAYGAGRAEILNVSVCGGTPCVYVSAHSCIRYCTRTRRRASPTRLTYACMYVRTYVSGVRVPAILLNRHARAY